MSSTRPLTNSRSRPSSPLISVNGITKSFSNTLANSNIKLSLNNGEIHALLGENGAGKSTLVKIIYGLVAPDSGEMKLSGQIFQPKNPRDARKNGIGMVFQHFSLFNALSVFENIAIGLDERFEAASLKSRIISLSKNYGLPLNPDDIVGNLSVGQQQRIEIVRCLLQNPKLLIMDEPTSVLNPLEVEQLFYTLKKLASEGTSILYISHKLAEVKDLCKRATVLRGGKVVDTCNTDDFSAPELAELMVGSSIKPTVRLNRKFGDIVLKLENLYQDSEDPYGTSIKNLNLEVKGGEILGVGGVSGNGQDELMTALSGELSPRKGKIFFKGSDISLLNAEGRRALGIFSAPEERLGHAACPSMKLSENVLITCSKTAKLTKYGIIQRNFSEELTREIINKFDVKTDSTSSVAASLSGGNLQKFVIGRELLQNPKLLIINQPTWGVDASAAAFIRQAIIDLAESGTAVVIISQDLDELIEVSDSFTALVGGRISDPKPMSGLKIRDIGQMMSGAMSYD